MFLSTRGTELGYAVCDFVLKQNQNENMVTLQTSTEARLAQGSTLQVYKDKATIRTNVGLCWHGPLS
jgi:hypothetical protein